MHLLHALHTYNMHMCIQTYIHKYIPIIHVCVAYIHAYMHTLRCDTIQYNAQHCIKFHCVTIHTYIQYIHTRIAHIHKDITYMHACMHTYIHTYTFRCISRDITSHRMT